ncbi:hypothetical protein [Microbacterium cremeum]|uniref:hypothetical protein n=1 Tax=Microbacterium cremeum TaxID=2782169 RepID=UPI0018870737|nr:hypothetical protein [Microbacterium cremeum]
MAPVVANGAAAEEPALVGVVGTLEAATPEANQESYWETRYADHQAECYKVDGARSSSHGTISADKKTITLVPFQDAWPGDHWEALIIKAGNTNNVIRHPEAGVAYASPSNGNNQADVSHWIVCKGTTPAPAVVVPDLQLTPPTCLAEGLITRSENADWTSQEHEDGTTTWTAVPKAGTVFETGVKISWTTPNLAKLTEGCESGDPEKPEPLRSVTTKTTFDCDSTTAVVTTTTTVTEHVWDAETETWVLGEPVSTDEVTERPLTQDELADCPLLPGEILSVCVGDVPYLGYEVILPEGYEVDSETPVTITFLNPDGDDHVVPGQPLAGTLLWPGASATEPKMWPGWELVDGEYAQTDGNFAWTREGITIRFEVNPSYSTEVEYPPATALCANPPVGGGEPFENSTPGTTPGLAATGGGVSPLIPAAAGLAVLLGIAALAVVAVRRRHTAS